MRTRWLFGDQLGPYFLDSDDQRVLLIESRKVFERRVFHALFATEDQKEGMAAFAEKRKPAFRDR